MASQWIVGNWKMNGSLSANQELVRQIVVGLSASSCHVAVCAPSVYLAQLQTLAANSQLLTGAQDVSAHEQGAFTGEVSAAMLREFAVRFAIVGHSERRQ
ncbi:MAG: triose-phosphate isomerase, partial [Burkholderiales bacterium]|nr:triose-phosphate isomerase [Burkholderiales bacterium]